MNGFFEFKAYYYFDGQECVENGVTYAEDFSTAMFNIEQYYGEDLDHVEIAALEPSTVYILGSRTV